MICVVSKFVSFWIVVLMDLTSMIRFNVSYPFGLILLQYNAQNQLHSCGSIRLPIIHKTNRMYF